MNQVALFGNPNTGKTSLFNTLTGSYEYVGNWSGVTVEKKVGSLKKNQGHLIDLPGVYSLSPISRDETVVTQFLLNEEFTEILNIVDASQLERNLHLTTQLMEFGKPIIIGLNMIDVAKNRGIFIDENKLAENLGTSVIPIVARTGKGCEVLGKQLGNGIELLANPLVLNYGSVLEDGFITLISLLKDTRAKDLPQRWLAIQFFEGNQVVKEFLSNIIPGNQLKELFSETEQKLRESQQEIWIHQVIYNVRKQYIKDTIAEPLLLNSVKKSTLTQRVDSFVTNRYLGIPVFLVTMYLVFMLTFDWLGTPLSDVLDGFISGNLASWIENGLNLMGASSFIKSLILDGIVAGVGGVLVFVPQIFILFFFISFLEDSGYMARIALVMDRLMEKVGLNGKSFIPMIIGFGCNVPGVMAARTIEQPKERLLTILLTPLMSCSARLPVYALFVGAFFNTNYALIVLSLYVLGIIVALILAKIFSTTILKGETSVFVIELPPYRLPQLKTLGRSTWDKGKGFVRKAGTFIFGGSVVIWLLSYAGPGGLDVPMNESFLAVIGNMVAPLLAPLGFGTWQAGASLLTGFLAKEVVVSTMNIIYHVPDIESLQGLMSTAYTPLSAYSFMVFILLYVPCLATVAVIQKEIASRKWMFFSIGYALAIAYILSIVVYQGGKMLGFS
jgi:ferrous iron transport protein B